MNIRRVTVHGALRWLVDCRSGGGGERRYFTSKKSAEIFAADKRTEIAMLGQSLLKISPSERLDLVWFHEQARACGTPARQIFGEWKAWKADRDKPTDEASKVSLAQAVAETVEAKQTAFRRPRYVRGLQSYLRLFARGREEMNIAEITPALIEDWFAARKEKPETRTASLGRLGALFDLAWRRGWIPENPCKRVERPSTERKPAAVLTSRQCEQLLAAAREFCPRFLPALILMMFAGVRPEETRRLCWEDVSLDAGSLNVGAAASKLRQRRVVHLSPNCVAWLRTVHGQEGLPAAKGQKRLRLVRRKAGIEQWPQDVLRHTACSMWLHRDSDAAKVAMEMGHSVQTMFRHYRNIVSDEECRLFWSLLPPSSDVSAAGSDAPKS